MKKQNIDSDDYGLLYTLAVNAAAWFVFIVLNFAVTVLPIYPKYIYFFDAAVIIASGWVCYKCAKKCEHPVLFFLSALGSNVAVFVIIFASQLLTDFWKAISPYGGLSPGLEYLFALLTISATVCAVILTVAIIFGVKRSLDKKRASKAKLG